MSKPSRVRAGVWCVGVPLGVVGVLLAVAWLVTGVVTDPIMVTLSVDVMCGVMVGVARWRKPYWFTYSPRQPRTNRGRVMVVAMVGTLVAFVTGETMGVWVYAAWGSAGFDATTRITNSATSVVMGLMALLVAPITEELVFRGVVYPLVRRHAPVWLAMMITAVTFGMVHANVVQAVVVIPLTWITTLMYEYTRTVWAPIGVHALFNGAALIVPPSWIAVLVTPVVMAVVIVVWVGVVSVTYPHTITTIRLEHGSQSSFDTPTLTPSQ